MTEPTPLLRGMSRPRRYLACEVRMVKEAPVTNPLSNESERYTETKPTWKKPMATCKESTTQNRLGSKPCTSHPCGALEESRIKRAAYVALENKAWCQHGAESLHYSAAPCALHLNKLHFQHREGFFRGHRGLHTLNMCLLFTHWLNVPLPALVGKKGTQGKKHLKY